MNRTLALIVLSLAACDGNNKPASHPDAPADARVPGDSPPVQPFAVAVAGDFMSAGVFSTLDVPSLAVTKNAVAGVAGDDPFLRHYGNELYIVNRGDGNNITILNAQTLALEDQLGTGTGSNPQDVAVAGDKLYVPALGTAGVVVLTRGSSDIKTIDLSTAVGDPDGKPDCISAYAAGTDVYVACGLLDASFKPRGPGQVAIIDTTTDTVRTTVALPYANPQNLMTRAAQGGMFGDDLLISLVPDFQDYTSGCLAYVTVGATPTAGCTATNQQLGGFVDHADVDAAGQLWLAVGAYDASFTPSGKLVTMSNDGTLGASVSASGEVIVDVAACPDGSVIAGDAAANATGLRVYANGAERTTAALPIGETPGGNGLACYLH